MDNARIGEYGIDLKNSNLMRYYERYGQMDETVDAYMHNLLTLQQLDFKDYIPQYYSDILLAIKRGPQPTGFKQAARPIIESMPYPEQFTGDYIAKYIKR